VAKFIVSKDTEIYTSHGPTRTEVIFEEYQKGRITEDFKIAGFFNAGEVLSSIESMEELICSVGLVARFSAIGMQPVVMTFYPGQRAMTNEGSFVEVEKANPGDLMLSLNGLLEVEYIELFDDEEKEQQHTYYIIETTNALPTLYVNNLIIIPVMEVDVSNPFFEHYQFI